MKIEIVAASQPDMLRSPTPEALPTVLCPEVGGYFDFEAPEIIQVMRERRKDALVPDWRKGAMTTEQYATAIRALDFRQLWGLPDAHTDVLATKLEALRNGDKSATELSQEEVASLKAAMRRLATVDPAGLARLGEVAVTFIPYIQTAQLCDGWDDGWVPKTRRDPTTPKQNAGIWIGPKDPDRTNTTLGSGEIIIKKPLVLAGFQHIPPDADGTSSQVA